ncbi:hypothetical protein GJ496_003946 [Pomphorhynchus laevis]|nr:hypothetical protein GJ496_003946 [Pomphorhynchus laevis]
MFEKGSRIQSVNPFPGSTEGWTHLIAQSVNQTIEESRPTFELLVEEFPTCSRIWQSYIESELHAKNYDNVEILFSKSLIKVLHIDLWKCYLNYLTETKIHLSNYRQVMSQAFEFALSKIGFDIYSQSIWRNYLKFLCDESSSFTAQSLTLIRSIYTRAMNIPMCGIEQIWDEYTCFEHRNQQIPLPLSDYIRQSTIELDYLIRPLDRSSPCKVALSEVVSLLDGGFEISIEEQKQWRLWQDYINWEKASKLQAQIKHQRICYAFEQCLLVQPHRVNAWIGYCQYLVDCKCPQVLESVFKRAFSTYMKFNMLLYLMQADYFESISNLQRMESSFQQLINLQEEYNLDLTLAVINYMQAIRRTKGVQAARHIFFKYYSKCTYHLLAVHALVEYHLGGGKKVAARIFELGMERFSKCPEFVSIYLTLLSNLKEDYNNTRVLFERILEPKQTNDMDKAKFIWAGVWQKFMQFERKVGNLTGLLSIEKRRIEALQQVRNFSIDRYSIALLCNRYSCLGLCPVNDDVEFEVYGFNDLQRLHTCPLNQRISILNIESTSQHYRLPEPNTSSMLPYNPTAKAPIGLHLLSGGIFLEPNACYELLRMLPPPSCFHGPFVMIDKLLDIIVQTEFNNVINSDTIAKPLLLADLTNNTTSASNLTDDIDLTKQNNLYRKRKQQRKHAQQKYIVKSGINHNVATTISSATST